jgi:hypothetical protein
LQRKGANLTRKRMQVEAAGFGTGLPFGQVHDQTGLSLPTKSRMNSS